MRHLVIVDLRPEDDFSQGHIRKAVSCKSEDYKQVISGVFINSKTNKDQSLSQYANDDLKRVLIVIPTGSKSLESQLAREVPLLS